MPRIVGGPASQKKTMSPISIWSTYRLTLCAPLATFEEFAAQVPQISRVLKNPVKHGGTSCLPS
jgi:hypothetical protein